jgi:D-glycero-D-manno-heptose 1,7-bisphosphate phosphatase
MVTSRPAVFIDRDGTLTEEVGYVNHPARLMLLPRAGEAIRRLNAAGVAAVVVTNQAGVARGYFSESVLHAVNESLRAQLARVGARLDGLYACLHHPSEGEDPYRVQCECRKPKPGLLLRAAAELGLDLARSTMIGDKASDLVPARRVGANAVLVLTGYGRGEWEYRRERFAVQPDHVAADLLDAVDWALARPVAA